MFRLYTFASFELSFNLHINRQKHCKLAAQIRFHFAFVDTFKKEHKTEEEYQLTSKKNSFRHLESQKKCNLTIDFLSLDLSSVKYL